MGRTIRSKETDTRPWLLTYYIISSSYSSVPTVPTVPKPRIPTSVAGTAAMRLGRSDAIYPLFLGRHHGAPLNGRAFALIASEPSVAAGTGLG